MILALIPAVFAADLDPFDLSGSMSNGAGGLTTEGASVPAEGAFGALHVAYAKDLSRLQRFDGVVEPGLSHALTLTGQAGWSFRDLARVEVFVPVAPWIDAPGSRFAGPSMGDVAVGGYVRLLGWGPAFALGISPRIDLPTAPAVSPISSGFGGRLALVAGGESPIGGAAVPPAVGWSANVGAAYHPRRSYFDVDVGSAVQASGAGWVRMGGARAGVEARLQAGVGASPGQVNPVGAEVDAFGQYTLENGLAVHAGVGTGLVSAVGVPAVRAVVGVAWTSPTRDGDRDGLPDRADACERAPEDRDGFEDTDGCPELDDDLDGLRDVHDKCPREPEDRDGVSDEDGCPDPDDDADGIPDTEDACPLVPGERAGCPDVDGDGVPDPQDECRDVAGSARTAGCLDTDDDGVSDLRDRCPTQAGDPPFGCPADAGDVEAAPADVLERVYFDSGSSLLPADAEPTLEAIARYMGGHPEVRLLEIAGHTDNQGNSVDNACLAQARADAAWRWLVEHGVAAERLVVRGYASNEPRDTNMTDAGRRHNRRVEFRVRATGAPDDPCHERR